MYHTLYERYERIRERMNEMETTSAEKERILNEAQLRMKQMTQMEIQLTQAQHSIHALELEVKHAQQQREQDLTKYNTELLVSCTRMFVTCM